MNQMILLFLLYLNFMMHCVYSNEIEEPQLDHIITSNLTGSERKVYKIKSTCDECTWFRIELADKYKMITDLNKYTDFSYEAALSTDPQYINSTTSFLSVEDSESYGMRRIILQIDPNLQSKAIYYSIIIKTTNGEIIPEDFTLEYLVKFSNADNKEELLPPKLKTEYLLERTDEFSFKLTFTELFNDKKILNTQYRALLVESFDYSIDGVKSVFDNNQTTCLEIKGKNNRQIIKKNIYSYNVPSFFTFLVTYTYNKSEYIIAFYPTFITYLTKEPNKIIMPKSMYSTTTQTYILNRERETDNYFVIEFNNELQNNGSYDGRELAISYKTEISREYVNSTIENTYKFENGRTVLILHTKDTNQLYFSFGTDVIKPIAYMFKYYTIPSLDEEHKFDFNNTVIAVRRGNRLYITFKEIFNSPNDVNDIYYYARVFYDTLIKDEYDLDNIYPSSFLKRNISEKKIYVTNTGNEYNFSLHFSKKIDYAFYVNIRTKFILNDGREESLSYKHSTVINKPQEIEELDDTIYNKITLNSTKKSISYDLLYYDKIYSKIFVIEIIEQNRTQSTYFDFCYETCLEYSQYKNNTEEIELISSKVEFGIHKMILKAKHVSDIMLTVFLKEGANAEVDSVALDIKYKVIEKIDDEPVYERKKLTIANIFSHCYLSYSELQDYPYLTIHFIITLYQQKDVPDIKMIENVNIHEFPSANYYNISLYGTNEGFEINKDFYIPNNFTDKLYARVVGIYSNLDSEETIDLLGIVEVVPYTPRAVLIFVILCICIFIIAGIIWIIYLQLKKKEQLNIIDDEISMKIF